MAIEINTAAEFAALVNLSEEERGTADSLIDININEDLDFAEIENFTGLGTTLYYANVNGNGHTIKNIVANTSDAYYLISLGNTSILRNLKFSDNHITTDNRLYFIRFDNSNDTICENIVIDNTNTFVAGGSIYLFYGKRSGLLFNKVAVSGSFNAVTVYIFYAATYSSSTGTYSTSTIRNCYVIANITVQQSCYIFYVLYCYNCFSRCKISKTKTSGYIYPFYGSSSYASVPYYCYTANEVTSVDENIYGIGATSKAVKSFYDNTLLTNAKDTANGQPAENLKSAEWLRSQGWAI